MFVLEDARSKRRGLMVFPADSHKDGCTAAFSTAFGPCFGSAQNVRFMEGGRCCLHAHCLSSSFVNNDPDGDAALTSGFQCCSKQNWMQIWRVEQQPPRASWRLGSALGFPAQVWPETHTHTHTHRQIFCDSATVLLL